ncbi:MAG: hypothetical protein M1457_00625 [bacterium]|nr:hypothetical protein [bacterium]
MGPGGTGGQAAPPPAAASPGEAVTPLPRGRIGSVELSRLILGCNLITFFVHSRGLRFVNNLSRHYNSEDKILETFAAAESQGVNAIMLHEDATCLRILKQHRDRNGGKLQWIVAPTLEPENMDAFRERVYALASDGVAAMYLHGNPADRLCADGKRDVIARALDDIKMAGLPAGVACHDLNVVNFCEKNDLGAEYYVKTFHHLNYPGAPRPEELKEAHSEVPGYWCKEPGETAAVMATVKKPWIAYKVMAAGAIPPRDAFTYAFSHGADFILAGMFDFEVKEDAAIAREAVAAAASRGRPWMG